MLSPLAVQIAVALLVVFCRRRRADGRALSAARPAARKSDKRLESIAAARSAGRGRPARGRRREGRRKRSVEDTLKELEDAQKAKARSSQKPTPDDAHAPGRPRLEQAAPTIWSASLPRFGTFAFALVAFGFGPIPCIGFGVSGGVLLPHFFVNFKRKRRLAKFSNEFANAVDVIVRGVKAGLPLIDCLKVIAQEAQEPVRSGVPDDRRGSDARHAARRGRRAPAGAHPACRGELLRHRHRHPVAHRRQPFGGACPTSPRCCATARR